MLQMFPGLKVHLPKPPSWPQAFCEPPILGNRCTQMSATRLDRCFRAGKKQQSKLHLAENGPFGTPFVTQKSARKSLCANLFSDLSQETEAHKLFLGVQKGVFWVGAKKFMCLLGPLKIATRYE